ncbi:MAG: hypothetical protein U0640_15750 [Phycisphaerales bacterium]
MTLDAQTLLRTLAGKSTGATTLQTATRTAATNAVGGLGGLDFAKLLQAARAGEVASGIKVTLSRDAKTQLTPDQLTRLATAADQAEAHGISRGLFLIDGKLIKMDVGLRAVLGEVSPAEAGVLTDIDGVINVPLANDAATQSSATQTSLANSSLNQVTNASLLKLLPDQAA